MKLLEDVDRLIAAKGKKLIRIDLKKDGPTQEELEKAMLGPTGKLRAPAFRRGRTLVIGFNQEAYQDLFGR